MTPSGLRKSLDVVAAIEAAKGVIVLLAGFGLLGLLHRDLHALGEELLAQMHLNPAREYPRIFIDLLSSLNDARLWSMAGMALLYSTIRLVEAYGLWKQKTWAEWLALAGGCIYLPFEIYEIYVKVTVVRVSALVFNLLIVLLMTRVLLQKRKNAHPK
ncbi:MAG: DUF2127 domain-containing protein [Prosthecobacter sp.]|uniref:DUF2127 domain-containing protein n=1 Tax=Prosthecobacter sp. TaxID=1965333 RepID=UPI0025E06708|nr:DUF2127 domain-containing protein [Prosthecobacter sp.]MCF7786614.1 DUF2127 domain-containing protein [Prosthecobacter sp.]